MWLYRPKEPEGDMTLYKLEEAAQAAFWTATRYRVREVALKLAVGLVMVFIWEAGQSWSERQRNNVLGDAAVQPASSCPLVELAQD